MSDDLDLSAPGGGASIVIRNPLSRIFGWLAVTLGGALVTGIWIAANNLYEINRTLAQEVIYKEWMAQQLAEVRALNDRQEEHINSVDRRVYTLEGRSMRGVPEVKGGR